jgi:hypothetical protein
LVFGLASAVPIFGSHAVFYVRRQSWSGFGSCPARTSDYRSILWSLLLEDFRMSPPLLNVRFGPKFHRAARARCRLRFSFPLGDFSVLASWVQFLIFLCSSASILQPVLFFDLVLRFCAETSTPGQVSGSDLFELSKVPDHTVFYPSLDSSMVTAHRALLAV